MPRQGQRVAGLGPVGTVAIVPDHGYRTRFKRHVRTKWYSLQCRIRPGVARQCCRNLEREVSRRQVVLFPNCLRYGILHCSYGAGRVAISRHPDSVLVRQDAAYRCRVALVDVGIVALLPWVREASPGSACGLPSLLVLLFHVVDGGGRYLKQLNLLFHFPAESWFFFPGALSEIDRDTLSVYTLFVLR